MMKVKYSFHFCADFFSSTKEGHNYSGKYIYIVPW